MVEAKDIATFTIEPVGADIYNPDSFTVRKRFQDTETTTGYNSDVAATMFQDISDEFGSGSSDTGCRIYLKNGLYEIDDDGSSSGGLIEWSVPAEGDHVNFYIEGETRDGVIIRNINSTMESTRIFLVRCNFHLRNLTMDGENLRVNNTFTSLIDAFGNSSGKPTLDVRDCHLMRANGSSCRTGSDSWGGMIVENCIIDQPCEFHDQIDIEVSIDEGYAHIRNNFLDRTNGTFSGAGSTITSGGGKNIVVQDNIIRRIAGNTVFGISLEGSFGDFEQCVIKNNYMENGRIWIGDTGSWSNTINNVWVTGNTIYQGGIYVQGPNSGGSVKNVIVDNNQLIDSWEAGIHIDHATQFCTIRNNMIKNSNKSLQPPSGREPLIHMEASTDVICENNSLFMGVVSPPNSNFCTHGIRYANLVNPTIRNNSILNRTVANNSYESIGSHRGSVLISSSF